MTTLGTLQFIFLLAEQAPAGTYTAEVVAEDTDGNVGNEVSATFEAE